MEKKLIKRHRTVRGESVFYKSIEEVIEYLNTIIDKYGANTFISTEVEYSYNDPYVEVEFSFESLETDVEFERRVRRREQEVLHKSKIKEMEQDEDFKAYKRLQKKYKDIIT